MTPEDRQEFQDIVGAKLYDPDLDQLNDFHGIGAYASSLDLVFAPMNTNSVIVGSVGVTLLEAAPEYMPVCFAVLPWFGNRKRLLRRWDQNWRKVTELGVEIIEGFVKNPSSKNLSEVA